MRTLRIAFLALLLSGLAGAALAQTSVSAGIHIGPSGRASVDIGFFYDDLASYGNWIERPSYGWVWAPRAVSTSWRPYQDGHWVWTDLGWTWVSDEPYGWATYHYGRWYDDPELGWVWVPGDEWGPAWVSWQEGDDYIGWAPLPPSVTLNFGGVLSVSLAPETYVFVPERYFLAPRITTYVVPETRVRGFWGRTRNFTRYRQSGGRIYNDGVPVEQVQRFVGRPVQRYQLADARSAREARIQGNQVTIFRPQVQRANVPPPPQRQAARRAVVDATQFQRSHPNHPGRRAAAPETSGAAVQPAPAPRPGRQPRAVQPPADQTQPAERARPRNRGKVQTEPEMTPPGHQRQVQPPPGQTERQRPPRQQTPPGQEKRQERQRPPQETPPQRPPRQVQPKPERQGPPPQQQQKQEQRRRQQENKKEKQQEEHKPPGI
ncbi:MAG TPA: DUF6600 domain-containing protein [Thermoanaerobaculia bacterium]